MLLQWYNKKQLPPSVVMKKAEASKFKDTWEFYGGAPNKRRVEENNYGPVLPSERGLTVPEALQRAVRRRFGLFLTTSRTPFRAIDNEHLQAISDMLGVDWVWMWTCWVDMGVDMGVDVDMLGVDWHLLIALLPDMPPVPKHTRASRAIGAKTQAGHEAAKSMEQLTAAHAALTAAHAAVTADLLSSQQLYSQLRERHCSLMVFAGQRDQQWELDLLGWVQHVEQLEEAFLQQLQATQAQLTDTAAALEAAQKDLAAARTELAHTKQQLTTTNIKLEQLRAQVDAANKGFSKDHKDKWNLLMRSRVSLPFLRGMLSSQGTKPAAQPACHPATQSSSLACPRNQECDTHTGGYTAEYILSRERLLSLPGVSAEQLGTLCTAVVGAVFPGRPAPPPTGGTMTCSRPTYTRPTQVVWLRRAFAVHVQLDGCTIPSHGKVVLYRVTAAVRCFSTS
ncbi:hypothetical protein QJQ45_002016 [Haematococcus lacustris]|nr:hypothetical protein QJQ45_002016 [Haematococcus lacustris]